MITIVDDAIPELDEVFCVSLILPRGGAEIGDIPEGMITLTTYTKICSKASIAIYKFPFLFFSQCV